MQAYSNPKRANDPHALPDVEVFEVWTDKLGRQHNSFMDENQSESGNDSLCSDGFYWWSCLPGCMPDSDPLGPFATEAEALADAQENAVEDDDSDDSPDASCDSCSATMIQGVYCHETGCPNARRVDECAE